MNTKKTQRLTAFSRSHGYSTVEAMADDFDRERDAALARIKELRLHPNGRATNPKEPDTSRPERDDTQIGMSQHPNETRPTPQLWNRSRHHQVGTGIKKSQPT
jgi:hypothetical protein